MWITGHTSVSLTYGQYDAAPIRLPFPTYAGTHCTYPRRDGQAELARVAGKIPRRSTIPALRRWLQLRFDFVSTAIRPRHDHWLNDLVKTVRLSDICVWQGWSPRGICLSSRRPRGSFFNWLGLASASHGLTSILPQSRPYCLGLGSAS